MEPCQSLTGSQYTVFEEEKAYLAEMEDILRLLATVCKDNNKHDAVGQFHMDVPAHTPDPAGPTMLSKLHDLQKNMDELKILFSTPCPAKPQPSVDVLMETYYEPELAPADQSAHANDGPEVYADKRKEFEGQGEEDPIRRRRPRNLADDTFDYEPRQSCPAPANDNPPSRGANPEPPPAAAPRRAAPAAAAPRARATIYQSAPPSQDPVEQIKNAPMRLTFSDYLVHCFEDNYNKALQEIKAVRISPRLGPSMPNCASTMHQVRTPAFLAAQAAGAVRPTLVAAKKRYDCLTVLASVNGKLFENAILDTGASHSMISQNAIRKLGLWVDIIKERQQAYKTALGDMVEPWGILKIVDVAVGVLESLLRMCWSQLPKAMMCSLAMIACSKLRL